MKLKSGDKIKFGKMYCKETGRNELLNKTIMLTPQYFEEDNGLYTYESECAGICIDDEPDSIYHLFGNNFEYFHDCEVITATEEDLTVIENIKEKDRKAIEEDVKRMVEYFESQNNN